jgi:hypothetical protein
MPSQIPCAVSGQILGSALTPSLFDLYCMRRPDLSLLNYDHRVIDMDGADMILGWRSCRFKVIPGVHIVDHFFYKFNAGPLAPIAAFINPPPIRSAQIFYNVQSSLSQEREERVEACALEPSNVCSVIENNVWCTKLIDNRTQKLRISLGTNPHLIRRRYAIRAFRIEVYPKNPGIRPEIVPPKLQ